MILEKHRVAAFDFDDTLVATIKNVWQQHKHVARTEFGLDITDEDLRKVWGQPFDEMVEELYGHSFEEVSPLLLKAKPDFPKEIFPGSISLLRRLRASQRVLALVTSVDSKSLAIDFTQNDISPDTFEHVFTIDNCEHRKPDGRVFDPLLAEGYLPEEVVYVGDSSHDFYASRDAGLDFIGVETGLLSLEGFQQLEGWQDSGAVVVASITELDRQFQ